MAESRRYTDYWPSALRFYARAAFWQSGVAWAPALIMPPLIWVLHRFRESLRGVLITMALGLCLGAVFFVGVLGTAIAYDLKRNRGASDPILEWNPLLFWRVLLQAGAGALLVGAFFFYRQGWWLSLFFAALAILCGFVAQTLVVTVRLPQRTGGADVEESHVPGFGKHER